MKIFTIAAAAGIGAGILGGSVGWPFMLFFCTFLIITAIEILRPKEESVPWDYMTIFYLMYCLLYILVPFHYIADESKFIRRVDIDPWQIVFISIMFILGYVFVLAGFTAGQKHESLPNNLSHVSSYTTGLFLLIFGIMSFLIYAKIYGGIFNLYKMSDIIRAGVTGGSGFVFFRKFIPFATFGAWILIAWIIYKTKISYMVKVTLIAVLIITPVAMTMATAGRLDVLFVIIPIYFAPFFIKNRLPPLKLNVTFLSAAIAWFIIGNPIFKLIAYKEPIKFEFNINLYYSFLHEFIHPFESFVAAVNNVPTNYGIRGLTDIYTAIYSLLPSRLLGIETMDPLSSLNTLILTGIYSAIIPPGMLGYFFHAFSYPGILIGCLLMGFLMRKAQIFFLHKMQGDEIWAYLYIAFGVSFMHFMMAGDPEVYLQNYFWLFSGTGFLLMYQHVISSFAAGDVPPPVRRMGSGAREIK